MPAPTISCDPSLLAEAAKCFDCVPAGRQMAIQTYLLALIAGGSTDPQTLATEAKCFQCVPGDTQAAIQNYLLCQIVNAL